MILMHNMASSSFNMSPYRGIGTHFKPNSMLFTNQILALDQVLDKGPGPGPGPGPGLGPGPRCPGPPEAGWQYYKQINSTPVF